MAIGYFRIWSTCGVMLVSMLVGVPSMTMAQERLLATYDTTLGSEDYFNSGGVRLSSLAGIIAQDRANFHRFNIRHDSDRSDPIFSNQGARTLIGKVPVTICCLLDEYILYGYDRGYAPIIAVSVFGVGNRITRLFVEVTGV